MGGASCFGSITKRPTYPPALSLCLPVSHHLAHCAVVTVGVTGDAKPQINATTRHKSQQMCSCHGRLAPPPSIALCNCIGIIVGHWVHRKGRKQEGETALRLYTKVVTRGEKQSGKSGSCCLI